MGTVAGQVMLKARKGRTKRHEIFCQILRFIYDDDYDIEGVGEENKQKDIIKDESLATQIDHYQRGYKMLTVNAEELRC